MAVTKTTNHAANGGLKDHSKESLHVLLNTIEDISKTRGLKSLLEESMEAARLVMNASASTLMLLDEETGELNISLPTGPVKEEIQGKRIPKNRGVGGWVIEHKQPFVSNDLEGSDIFWGDMAKEFKTRNIICVPLINKNNKAIGVLQALNRRDGQNFTPHDIPVFQALAAHVTIAIERVRELDEIKNQLQAKQAMLKEVHHRIKNNLYTLSALIEVELSDLSDGPAKQILEKTCSRIGSITEVHNLLYKGEITSQIDLAKYIGRLVTKISSALTDPVSPVHINLEASNPCLINADRGMLCGMILNELMINAYKYAFKDQKEEGVIHIRLTKTDEYNICLDVSDNGKGMGENFKFDNKVTSGSWIVNAMLKQLGADAKISSEEGSRFSITIPSDKN